MLFTKAESGGQGGIRTREETVVPYPLSRRAPSAARPPVRSDNNTIVGIPCYDSSTLLNSSFLCPVENQKDRYRFTTWNPLAQSVSTLVETKKSAITILGFNAEK